MSACNGGAVARARGCMLGLMVGDALGAAVEGFDPAEIHALCMKEWNSPWMKDFILAVPMGTFVSAGEVNKYRPAIAVSDQNFVRTGPPSNDDVATQCARFGMYTDDTNSCLAVGASLVERQSADANHIAKSCAEFFRDNEAYRGCPPTAKRVQQAVLSGVPAEETGLPPYFPYADGSFANGGGMRISPLAIAFRNADSEALATAVRKAVLGTHRHPEAVDFALVQAMAVQYSLNSTPETFDTFQLLTNLANQCASNGMREVIEATAKELNAWSDQKADDYLILQRIVDAKERKKPGSGMGFQIASVHMAPCVLWSALRYYHDPCRAVQTAIAIGGDTDTTASMVGAIVGALHGESWCDPWIAKLENGAHGRDYALSLAENLAALDLHA